jgi:hypothetical protein
MPPGMRAHALVAAVFLCTARAHTADLRDVDRFPASMPLGTVSVSVTPTALPPSISAPTRLRAAGITALEASLGTTVVLTGLGGPYGAIAGILLSPVAATVGALVGAIRGPDAAVVRARVAVLQRAVAAADVPRSLARAMVASGRPDRPPLVLDESADAPSGTPLHTRLVLDLPAVALENPLGDSSADPPLMLVLRLHARLISPADGLILFERSLEHVGASRYLSEWAVDD